MQDNSMIQKTRNSPQPRLVAVSKFKTVDEINEAYMAGQRHFGENYVQELVEKASQLPDDIQWHFIGSLQGNKFKQLLEVKNLWIIETVDSSKHARQLNELLDRRMKIFIQVNTSGEGAKSGTCLERTVDLANFIVAKCTNLELMGLMTIGAAEGDPRFDFQKLISVKETVALNVGMPDLELSMGMSGDFETAIAMGSTNVRVGSAIFGERQKQKESNKCG